MAEHELPLHIPRLNFWDILGLEWPPAAKKPSSSHVRNQVRRRIVRAQDSGALTARVAWEILESAKAFLDVNLTWSMLLAYGHRNCDPRKISNIPAPSLYPTEEFARRELTTTAYKRQVRGIGPELRSLDFDQTSSFADLFTPSALPSICIGSLSMNGRLVFAFIDAQNRLQCTVANIDEWGLTSLRPYHDTGKILVCLKPPFTTISDGGLKKYISAYASWINQPPNPTQSTDDSGVVKNNTEVAGTDS